MLAQENSIRQDVFVLIGFWLVGAVLIIIFNWETVSALELRDNDDYMRFAQFQHWMEEGDWYLVPMHNFNPQDGVLIHWSRLPDIMLSSVAIPLLIFLPEHLAYTFTISVVPLFYLLVYLLSVFYLGHRLFGVKYRFVSMLFAIASPAVVHFLPGAIDHHNIQLMLGALFLVLSPIKQMQLGQRWRINIHALVVGLSFWVGLDNIFLFGSYFLVYTTYSCLVDAQWREYVRVLLVKCTVTVLVAILLNRPVSEFFTIKSDEVSFLLVFLLLSGYAFILFFEKSVGFGQSKLSKVMIFIFVGLLSLTPTVLLFPSFIDGLLIEYPSILKMFWLDYVSEAKPIYYYVNQDGFLSRQNYVLLFIPALLFPFFKQNNPYATLLYLMLVVNLLLAYFWQLRVTRSCFLLAAPLQAYVVLRCAEYLRYLFVKVVFITLGGPLGIAFILLFVNGDLSGPSFKERNQADEDNLIDVLNSIRVKEELVLTGIESGSQLLARTKNRIIAAPYHRNIRGNTFLIETMLEEDLSIVRDKLLSKGVGIVVVGNDSHLVLIKHLSNERAFIRRLYSQELPSWLERVYSNKQSSYQVFRVREYP
ncbi:hypothetical protein KI743_09890 [Vibrio sp. D420a]|nr:hypothetical protein [Vibrio sp. D420a]